MVVDELFVVDQRWILAKLLCELRMVVKKLIERGQLAACKIVVVVLHGGLRSRAWRLCPRRRCPDESGERQGCQPISSCHSCAFHNSQERPPKPDCFGLSGFQMNLHEGGQRMPQEHPRR